MAGKKANTPSVDHLGEAPFRQLADHLPALCFIADRRGRVVWCNRRWYDYTGVPPDADPDPAWPGVHDPSMLADVARRWSSAIESGEAGEAVLQIRGADGRFRPFLTRAEPVRGGEGISCWLGTMTEITEQRQSELDQRFLVGLNDLLRDTTEPNRIVSAVGEALSAHLSIACVGYARLENGDRLARIRGHSWGDGKFDAKPVMLSPAGMAALGEGRSHVVSGDADEAAFIHVPLLRQGALASVFTVRCAQPHAWRDSEVRLIEDVAERSWAALERAAAEAARRESEDRLRLALDGARLGAIEWDLRTMRGRWSDRACAIYGVERRKDITVDQFRAIIHPEDRDRVLDVITDALARKDHYSVDYRVRHPGGEQRWVVSRAKVQRNGAGKAVGTIGLVMDVTAQKQAEERLRESEARQRAIVDTTPECVKIVDGDGRLLYMNHAGLRMIDAEGGAQGIDVASIVAPEDRAQWIENHRRVCNGESISWAFDAVGLRGSRRRMETHAVPLPAADGSVQQLAVTRDVTERCEAEKRLRESEALLAAFMKNAPVGMYLKDANGRYLMLNPEMAKVFRAPADTVIGKTAADLFGPDEAAMIAAHDRRILEGGQPRSVEEYLPDLDAYGWSLVVRFPVSLAGERPTRIGGFDIDISERKRTELELARSREMLYQSEKLTALGSLLAGVSHELNNPLSVILAQAQLLEAKAEGTPLAERAVKIRSAATRCAKIVQSFLAMARQKAPARTRLAINDVVRSALDLTGYALRAADIRVVEQLAADLPPIEADGDQLNQVLVNLIVNAQHVLEDQPPPRTLTIRTALGRGGMVRIAVSDNGPGVPPDVRRRIFEPFFTTKPQGGGTGIGLAISLGIVEAHGGTLQLADEAREGACFVIELPAAIGEVEPITILSADPPRAAPATVLVIDDDPDVGDALAELLAHDHYRVEVARSGTEAQALLGQRPYDIVLSDVRMPGFDGQALFDWIAREQPHYVPRLGFITGDTLGCESARFLAAAGRPVLEKPFDADGLHRLLDQLNPPIVAQAEDGL